MWHYVKLSLLALGLLVGLAVVIGYAALSQDLPTQPTLSGKIVHGTLESEGRPRQWRAYVPAEVSEVPPLIIVLHGSMGSSATARVNDFGYDFDRIADEVGAIVAYPHGVEGHWNDVNLMGNYAAKVEQVDDVAFLHALADHMVNAYQVDRSAVLVTGVSNGGGMVARLALQTPTFARAYAVVAANLPTPGNMVESTTDMPVSILFLNGTEDPIVPWEGGEMSLWPVVTGRGEVRSVEESLAYFRRLARVKGAPDSEALADLDRNDGCTVRRTTWVGPQGHRIVQVVVQGGGHGAPHPQKRGMRLLGKSNRDIHAAEAIWEFFASTAAAPQPRGVHDLAAPRSDP